MEPSDLEYALRGIFWDTVWRAEKRLRRVGCWFTGHDIEYADKIESYYGEPDGCRKCYMHWPDEAPVLHDYLNRLYVWFVLRDWGWFNRMDDWLCNYHGDKLPGWWEY